LDLEGMSLYIKSKGQGGYGCDQNIARKRTMGSNKKIDVIFYKNLLGHEPVREWLRELDKDDKKIVGEDIKAVEFGWPLGLPLVRPLGKGLWEVRSTLATNKIARIIFCIENGYMILLHGFIKKTQKTPDSELALATKRKKDLL